MFVMGLPPWGAGCGFGFDRKKGCVCLGRGWVFGAGSFSEEIGSFTNNDGVVSLKILLMAFPMRTRES